MKIGIDASRAFLAQRTGIEEYSYQVIKHLRRYLAENNVVLYLREGQVVDFDLPKNWQVKAINRKRLWTQLGLSFEILKNPADTLFIPAHTVPFIHPKNTIVTVHGIEYEIFPKAYSFWERLYMRLSIKKSCKWAKKIIAVSVNTKKDLQGLYKINADKIKVVYEGYDEENEAVSCDFENIKNKFNIEKPYFLFIGRIEERKNIVKIVEAFTKLRKDSKIRYQLVLSGRGGFGFKRIQEEIMNSDFKDDIILTGFVSNEEKNCLLKNAQAFVFTTLYEGFGIPILEAQSRNCPVISSNVASMPEISGESALLVNPKSSDEIANAMRQIAYNKKLKEKLIKQGKENILRFSWDKCAKEIAYIIGSL